MRVYQEFKLWSIPKDISKDSTPKFIKISIEIIIVCFCSRPEDGIDSVRVECTFQNYPADNNTLELAERTLNALLLASARDGMIFFNNSGALSGKLKYYLWQKFVLAPSSPMQY